MHNASSGNSYSPEPLALPLTLVPFSVPLQSSSLSAMCWASAITGTRRSEGPQPSSVEPSYRLHSPKRVTTYTPGWPVCRVQQVSVCVCVWRGLVLTYFWKACCWLFKVLNISCVSCSPGNPVSLVDLVPLLQKTLKDESSVTCKMACSAVRVRHLSG